MQVGSARLPGGAAERADSESAGQHGAAAGTRSGRRRRASASRNAASNVSPAPVVSTTGPPMPGTDTTVPSGVDRVAPFAPSLTTTSVP